MTQRYFVHLSTVSVMHILLLLGGGLYFQSHEAQMMVSQKIVQFNIAKGVMRSSFTKMVSPAVAPSAPISTALSRTKKFVSSKAPDSAPLAAGSTSEAVGDPNGSGPAIGTPGVGTQVTDLKILFKAELREKIDQIKTYPAMSRRLGHQGRVVVAFTLLEDGSITNVRLDSGAPFEALNNSAVETVKSLKKFKSIPKEFGVAQMDLTIPIRYGLQ